MTRQSARIVIVIALILGFNTSGATELEPLEPAPLHSLITQLTATYALRLHYATPELDDALSEAIHARYLDVLDPQREYFLPEDIAELEKYRHSLDDALKLGDLSPAVDIFNVFRSRVIDADETAAAQHEEVARMVSTVTVDDVFEQFLNVFLSSLDPHSAYYSPHQPKTWLGPIEQRSLGQPDAGNEVHGFVIDGENDRRVAVIRIPRFRGSIDSGGKRPTGTARDVQDQLDRLSGNGIEGLVLDVRGNPGGALQDVLDVAGLFLGNVPVAQARDTTGKLEVIKAGGRKPVWTGPLLVLVDSGSAAGAEILTAAIQDHGAGIIAGDRTHGMAIAQNVFELNRLVKTDNDFGRLKLPVGMYFRVTGEGIQRKGVLPDVVLPSVADPDAYREEQKFSALPHETIKPARHKGKPFSPDILEGLGRNISSAGQTLSDDPALIEAVAVLLEFSERAAQTR